LKGKEGTWKFRPMRKAARNTSGIIQIPEKILQNLIIRSQPLLILKRNLSIPKPTRVRHQLVRYSQNPVNGTNWRNEKKEQAPRIRVSAC